jgi:hypothetical protein
MMRLGGSLTNLLLFVISLRSFWTRSPLIARVFAVQCFLEVIADTIVWVTHQDHTVQITSNLITLSEQVVYTFIFLQIIHSRGVRWILAISMSILFLLYLWVFWKRGLSYSITFDMELMNYLVFFIPAFTYFKEIFTFQQEGDLLKDFTFWFVTASLFIFASTIISRLGLWYLFNLNPGDSGNNFFLLASFVFILENILYSKAYLCLRK